ncbi:DNA helicase [Fusarium pseudocircinatum]|uniref:DNA helicase n=1 Tax=Fusarium pseudocircinatum TaxID=56676 RepID=A0A8H5PL61_9HYPO|nr:DNA helicase [Fusarium pseudocircinatum]
MATTSSATVTEDCAVFFGHHGPLIASGDNIGLRTKIKAQLRSVRAWDCDTWIGLTLDFPLGKDQKANEDAGFGVRYRAPEHGSQDRSKLCDYHQIRIKFPRNFSYEVQQGQSPSTFTNEYLSYVKLYFGEARATIEGFGIPFANQEDHQVESWINGNAPIAEKYHLLDILQQQTLYLVLPAKSSLVKILGTTQNLSTFRYPYSEDFSWAPTRFQKELRDVKGQQFAPLYSHPTDVSHMTALSQSVKQDTSWLNEAAKRAGHTYPELGYRDRYTAMNCPRMPGYFFRCQVPDIGAKDCLHLVIPFAESLVKTIGPAWKHLIKQRVFRLEIFTSRGGHKFTDTDWVGRIASLGKLDRYARHRKDTRDLILVVRPGRCRKTIIDELLGPISHQCHNCCHDRDLDKFKTFADRQSANEALLNGDNNWNYVSLMFESKMNQSFKRVNAVFSFDHQACPFNPFACELPTKDDDGSEMGILLEDINQEQQKLLDKVKDKMDLHRFVLRGAGFHDWMIKTGSTGKWRPLPTINILDVEDQTYIGAVLETALPEDRARFTTYLSDRPLGIGIITGPPGSGKTSTAATAALALQAKVGKVLCSGPTDTAVDDFAYRLNKQTWDVTERLNAGNPLDELSRYRRKLIVRPYPFDQELRAFYLLLKKPELGKEVLDDWKFTGEPNEDVNWKLELSATYWLLLILRSPALDRVLGPEDSLALNEMQQVIDGDEIVELVASGHLGDARYRHEFEEQLEDIFKYLWKMLINSADFLFVKSGGVRDGFIYDIGDPSIRTTGEKDPDSGNYYNRFVGDGRISGLEFLQASGLPVFRLNTQVRMAKGMYDLAAQVFYPQLPLQYHQRDHDITDQQPDVGRELEAYVHMKYPLLRKPPDGIVHQPLFIHRQNSTIYKDVDGSQACQEQDSAVLSFVAGLVTHSAIDPAQIVILTPWFANAVLIERKRNQKRFELLKNMPEAATIESYRGREADIVVVVMSTTRDTGPDITANEHLLITMLTRHKSGLVIFGDICTSGVIGEDRNGKLFKINKPGQELNALQRIDETLFDEGRVAVFSTKLGK